MVSSKLPGIPNSYALTPSVVLCIFLLQNTFFFFLNKDIALMDQLRLMVKTMSNITVLFHFFSRNNGKMLYFTTNQEHKLHELLLPGTEDFLLLTDLFSNDSVNSH